MLPAFPRISLTASSVVIPLVLLPSIAKYLTPNGRDIHKHGIKPDVRAKLSAREIQSLRLEDLGTQKDSQYRVAESTLPKQVKAAGSLTKSRPYNPASANVPAALAAPVQ